MKYCVTILLILLLLSCNNVESSDSLLDTDGNDTATGDDSGSGETDSEEYPLRGLEWVTIPAGTFEMGRECSGDEPDCWVAPVHQVELESFEILKTEVTMAQYQSCMAAGACDSGILYGEDSCEGMGAGHVLYEEEWHQPKRCLNWEEARQFCQWLEGDLPSEAQWEYAARGGQPDARYPWGDASPDCDRAVMSVLDGDMMLVRGCGERTIPDVCSRPLGNSVHGLCDMLGSVGEWTLDCDHSNYDGAPTDGSAWMDGCGDEERRIVRGGSRTSTSEELDVWRRPGWEAYNYGQNTGFRCVRDGGYAYVEL